MQTPPGEEFRFDITYYTNKIGEFAVLLELSERKRQILYNAYVELKNKYEPDPKPQVELDMKDSVPVEEPVVEEVLVTEQGSDTPKVIKKRRNR